jgi:hypothetical protein
MRWLRRCGSVWAAILVTATAFAGFASTETFLPAVGRVTGQGGAQFYTTVWATNLTSSPVSFTFDFLKQGQANSSPISFTDSLAAGETKVYENIIENKFSLTGAIGAARVTSTGEILVAERIYDQPAGADVGNTVGLFFAGVPKSFSISLGQAASIQGINQGGAENFRYNFALVETSGGSPTVNVQLFDGSGTLLGQKAYIMKPYEQLQPNVADVFAGIATTNARITATVTGGNGSVLLAGAQLANESQDSSGFEMSFRDQLLGGGGAAGVTSLNALTGALNLVAGNGITITPSGNAITIAANGGGAGGLTLPYSNSASNATGSVFAITNSASSPSGGFNEAILGIDGAASGLLGTAIKASAGVTGDSNEGSGVLGLGSFLGVAGVGNVFGVYGIGVTGIGGGRVGVVGVTELETPLSLNTAIGVVGGSLTGTGVVGEQGSDLPDLTNLSGGVVGASKDQYGVVGRSTNGYGIGGFSDSGDPPFAAVSGFDSVSGTTGTLGGADYAVKGTSPHGNAIFGLTNASGGAGVQGQNGPNHSNGYLGGPNYGVFGLVGAGNSVWGRTESTGAGNFFAGVYGEATGTGIGVFGDASNGSSASAYGVYGKGQNAGVFAGDVTITGHLTAHGAALASLPHPIDASKEIHLGVLEGPESGTYFRGTAKIQGGFARIPVPEAFRAASSPEGLTVMTTPVGSPAVLFVAKESLDEIVIQGSSDVDFHYVVNGIRRNSDNFRAVVDNEHFVPRSAGDRNFMAFADPGVVATLKANGILNADGTINLETAHRLGWDKRPGWNEAKKTAVDP